MELIGKGSAAEFSYLQASGKEFAGSLNFSLFHRAEKVGAETLPRAAPFPLQRKAALIP